MAGSGDRPADPGLGTKSQVLLTTAAGCVNAIGFLTLGGVFTSVMTANSALLGLALGNGDPAMAKLAGVAIVAYLAGAVLGGSAAARSGRGVRSGMRGALAVECVVLSAVWAFWLVVDGRPQAVEKAVLLAASCLAMGCQSGGVRVASGGALTTAYMTGAMTGVVTDFVTRRRFDRHVALIVLLLPVGAAIGGLTVRWARLAAPAVPVLLVAAALAVVMYGGRSAARRHHGAEHSD